jgi:hypothetical protein
MDGGVRLATVDEYDELIFQRLLDEVYLLLDFVSGRADKSLSQFDVTMIGIPDDHGNVQPAKSVNEVITHICALRYPPNADPVISSQNAAFLLLVKDELNRLADPAIGLTVAYTTMVVGAIDEAAGDGKTATDGARVGKPSTRRALAARAYPGLVASARWLRRSIRWGLVFMFLLTVSTVFISGIVAIGHGVLQTVEAADAAVAQAITAVRGVEHADDKTAGKALFYRLCDRQRARSWQEGVVGGSGVGADPAGLEPIPGIDSFGSMAEHEACDQWNDAERKRHLADQSLTAYVDRFFWFFEWPITSVNWVRNNILCHLSQGGCADPRQHADDPAANEAADLAMQAQYSPEWVADVLAGLSNYLLPLSFTILGAGVSIVRDLQASIRRSLLGSRDLTLAWARLALGMVAGAAIGLFYSPSGATAVAAGAAGGFSFTVSGLAFLAGYGVDSVFAAFDRMLRRFTDPTAASEPAPRPLAPAAQPAGG